MITRLIVNSIQICGNNTGTCTLLKVSDLKEYVEGKATGKILGTKYHVVCEDNLFEKVTVKINGKPILTNEQIQQKGGKVKVNFKTLTGKFYRNANTGEYMISCSADGIEVVA